MYIHVMHIYCVSKYSEHFSFNMNKHCWILVIFGSGVFYAAGNKTITHFPTSHTTKISQVLFRDTVYTSRYTTFAAMQ